MERQPCVYILASKRNGTLYVGVTSNLPKRIWEHQNETDPKSFTAKYQIKRLVYFEICENMEQAITREKQLKSGNRARKIKLIESANPEWEDLSEKLE